MKKATKGKAETKSSVKSEQKKLKNAKNKRGATSNKKSNKLSSKKKGAKKRSKGGLGILKPALRKKIELALTQLEEVLGKLEDKAIKKLS